jgi:hypothetical protein
MTDSNTKQDIERSREYEMDFGPVDDLKRGSTANPPWRVKELTFENAGEGLIHPYASLFTIANYWPYGYFTSRRRCELPGKLFRARASGENGDQHHFLSPAFWGAVNRYRMVDGRLHYAWRVRPPQRRVAGGRFSYVRPSQGPWEIWCNRDENDAVVWTLHLLNGGSWTTRLLPDHPDDDGWVDVQVIADPRQLSLQLDQRPDVTFDHDAYSQPFHVQFGSGQSQSGGEEVVSEFRYVYLDVLSYPYPGVGFDEGPEDLQPGDDAIVGYFQTATPTAPRVSEGDMVLLKDGRLLCVYSYYHAGEGWDGSPAYLAAATSDDGGRTWSKPRQMLGMEEGSADNVMSASLLRAANDDLLIAYVDKTLEMKVRGMVLRRTSDDGRTWSARQAITPDNGNRHYANNACLVALSSGRIVLAVREYIGDIRWPYALFSDDDGRTWQVGRHVPDPELTDEQKRGQNMNEPSICELADGRLLMTMRSIAGGQFFSWSSDQGETWTKPVLSPLRGACSPAILRCIPDSNDVLALFTYHYGNRTRLLSAVSDDGGLTWRHLKRVEQSEYHGYCYASCIFVDDRVLFSYMHSPSYEAMFRFEVQPGYIDGRFVSLPLSWFYRDVEEEVGAGIG